MTRQSLEELVNTWRPRYLRASRKEKTKSLDEFVALTGYHRKSAIRLLRKGREAQEVGQTWSSQNLHQPGEGGADRGVGGPWPDHRWGVSPHPEHGGRDHRLV
jgi:hypothetical protein